MKQRRNPAGIDAKGPRAATHAQAAFANLEIRIYADRHRWPYAEFPAELSHEIQLRCRFDVDDDTGRHGAAQLFMRLAGTGKSDPLRAHTCVEREHHFAG